MIIKINKIKEDKRKEEEWYQGIKSDINLMSTILFYLNLSKILNFLFLFKKKKEKI